MLNGKSQRSKEIVLKDKKKDREWIEHITLVTQLGLTVIGSILFCFAIGYHLDKWLHTKGIFMAIFIILGIAGGAYTAYRQILEIEREHEKRKKKP